MKLLIAITSIAGVLYIDNLIVKEFDGVTTVVFLAVSLFIVTLIASAGVASRSERKTNDDESNR